MKVLLLTDMPPCTNYTAGIFLNHLVGMLPREDIVVYSVLNSELTPEIPREISGIPIKTINKPRESWGFVRMVGPLLSFVMETVITSVDIPRISADIAEFARAHQVDAIWCTLEGQTMIRLALKAAELTNLPLYTHIWDTPGWWMRAWKVNSITSRGIIQEYEKAIRLSAKCGVASWAMKAEYESSYGVECVPLVGSLEKELALPPAVRPHLEDGSIQIGIAGQIYALDTWEALIHALDSVNWTIHGLPVKIKVLGQWLNPMLKRAEIEFLGWHSQKETIEILSRFDILYAPYWFDPAFEQEARFSFPSKVTTYLAAGRPVFFHGPEYSSPGRFLDQNNAGLCCHSQNPLEIAQQLTRLISDEVYYQQVTANGHALFHEKLTLDALRESLYAFLPLEVGK
jgi:glycosyltransferase involved in cell wall biosynthesis